MIQQETRLKVADNTGAKEILLYSCYGAALQEDMQISATLSLLLLKMQHQAALLKKGDVVKAVVVRSKKRRSS